MDWYVNQRSELIWKAGAHIHIGLKTWYIITLGLTMPTIESMIVVGPNQTLIFSEILIKSKAYLFHNVWFGDGNIFHIWMVWLKFSSGRDLCLFVYKEYDGVLRNEYNAKRKLTQRVCGKPIKRFISFWNKLRMKTLEYVGLDIYGSITFTCTKLPHSFIFARMWVKLTQIWNLGNVVLITIRCEKRSLYIHWFNYQHRKMNGEASLYA